MCRYALAGFNVGAAAAVSDPQAHQGYFLALRLPVWSWEAFPPDPGGIGSHSVVARTGAAAGAWSKVDIAQWRSSG